MPSLNARIGADVGPIGVSFAAAMITKVANATCTGSEEPMPVRHVDDVEASTVAGARDTTIQVLISAQEGPHFALRKFSMQKGGGMPRHTNTVEHEQYVLRGQATITIGDEMHQVRAGDVVFIPAGVAHSYENTGAGAFEFLCIVPNDKDEITIVGDRC
jgi:quercetin dioxygenase-like cupin family protein